MVSADHKLNQRRQCAFLRLSRARLDYQQVGEGAKNLKFIRMAYKQF